VIFGKVGFTVTDGLRNTTLGRQKTLCKSNSGQ